MKSRSLLTTEEVARPLPFAWYWTFTHAWVLAKRRLTQIPRAPDELLFATVQPTMWVLLFRYIFGGAILAPGTSYANYLMAGVFVMASLVGSLATGIGMATDLGRGLIDRLREGRRCAGQKISVSAIDGSDRMRSGGERRSRERGLATAERGGGLEGGCSVHEGHGASRNTSGWSNIGDDDCEGDGLAKDSGARGGGNRGGGCALVDGLAQSGGSAGSKVRVA